MIVDQGVAICSKCPKPAVQAVQTLSYESVGPKVWTVGTLVYGVSGLVLLFIWLLWGDFALSMRDRSVGPLIEKFLLKHGASNTFKQLLTATLPTVIGLILGPIISYRSDRLRGRWGRRIPFLIVPTPVAGAAMVGIAFSPQLGEWLYGVTGHTPAPGQLIHEAASTYTMSVFAVFWTIFEVAVIVSGAVFGGLINDVVPRPVLGRFHGLFRAISLYDGILFNSILFKHAEEHFTLMFALIGLLFGCGFTLMCLKVKEGNYPPPPPVDPELTRDRGLFGAFAARFGSAFKTFFSECFTQPYYLIMFAMFVLAGLTFNPINAFSYRYSQQLKMADGDYGVLIGVSYLVSLTIAFPLGMIVDRVHTLRASIVTMAIYSLLTLYGSLFVHDAWSFGVAFIGHTILSGTYFTCAASLGQQLYPRSKFSQYASAGGIMGSLVGLVFAPSLGAVLDLTNNNYHLTFWFGLVISAMTIVLMLVIYQRFNTYGGVRGYVAPGDDAAAGSKYEPPRHMFEILLMYFIGAFAGIVAGYVLAFFVLLSRTRAAGLGFTTFHQLLFTDSDARGWTTFCIATGVIPGAILGAIAGTKWVKAKSLAIHH
ncbi:MAG: MFS transporter [Tepidisphaeraceae bacterium]